MKNKIKQYLNNYLDKLPEDKRNQYSMVDSFYFCADKQSANICSELVKKGIKTATCSMKYWYENDSEVMPKVGQLSVITDWDSNPTSIIEIVSVSESKFCDVGDDFAYAEGEGEGDRSLKYWKKVHWDFFSKECKEIGMDFSVEMMLVMEKFKVVYF